MTQADQLRAFEWLRDFAQSPGAPAEASLALIAWHDAQKMLAHLLARAAYSGRALH
jgi:hypothetical protein